MKTIKYSASIKIPKTVKVQSIKRLVIVSGARGRLRRDFSHLRVDLKTTKNRVHVTKFFGTKKEAAAVRTICSHIENMIKGVTVGFRYKMKSVYAHFPINMITVPDGSKLEVRNFLGEKNTKYISMVNGVKVMPTGQKDEIQVEGNNIEDVAKCAALIQQSCKVRNKDIRKFLDGVYVSSKTHIDEV